MYDPYALGLDVISVSGEEAVCLCPFHNDRTPSFSFNMNSGLSHCFACGENSNIYRLAKELGGEIIHSHVVAKVRQHEAKDWEWVLLAPLARNNWYLQKRGVSNKLVDQFSIREVSGGVAFINYDLEGKATGCQVRRYDGSPRYLFYGQRFAIWPTMSLVESKPSDEIFIVEGVFGALRGTEAGKKAIASMSASAVGKMINLLNGRRKTVLFDNDMAGHLGAAKLVAASDAQALLPGAEADELSVDEWNNLGSFLRPTRSMYDIAEISSDRIKVKRLAEKFAGLSGTRQHRNTKSFSRITV